MEPVKNPKIEKPEQIIRKGRVAEILVNSGHGIFRKTNLTGVVFRITTATGNVYDIDEILINGGVLPIPPLSIVSVLDDRYRVFRER